LSEGRRRQPEGTVRGAGRRWRSMGRHASAAAGSQQPPARTRRPVLASRATPQPQERVCAGSTARTAGSSAAPGGAAQAPHQAAAGRPGRAARGGWREGGGRRGRPCAPGSSRHARSSCAALCGPSAAWSSSAAACHSARRAGGTAKPTLPAGPRRAQAPRTRSAWSCGSAAARSARRARGTAMPSLPGMKQAQSQDSAK